MGRLPEDIQIRKRVPHNIKVSKECDGSTWGETQPKEAPSSSVSPQGGGADDCNKKLVSK
jgi:hypothetical protein